jgi:hypothetical protein
MQLELDIEKARKSYAAAQTEIFLEVGSSAQEAFDEAAAELKHIPASKW